jgi:hypothetical protein
MRRACIRLGVGRSCPRTTASLLPRQPSGPPPPPGPPPGARPPHTHTHRLFLGLFIRHGQIYAPGTSSAPNQEARGREAKTESAPRKNSLGPTIKLQGEPESKRRFRTPPCFRRPGRGAPEGKVGRLPKGGGVASHGGPHGNGCGGCLVGQVALGIARCMERSADCFAWRYG